MSTDAKFARASVTGRRGGVGIWRWTATGEPVDAATLAEFRAARLITEAEQRATILAADAGK